MSTDSTARAARPFDVVVWGATGFTGRLVAEHLARAGGGVRWAMAGRNHEKLAATRDDIAARVPSAASAPLLVGDAGDPASLDAIASQARVVCATVGPFAKHGEPIVAACVKNGADYCDITGEPHFIRRIIDTYDQAARAAGVRVVPTCGFDSIPSDLGVLVLAEHAREELGRALAEVRAYVTAAKGGMSGGTAASMLLLLEAAASDRALRRLLADPYGLSPDRANDLSTDGRDPLAPRWDGEAGGWAAPWMMAAINTRVVRRSNALLGHRYGKGFRYQESMLMKGRLAGGAMAAGTAVGMGVAITALSASAAARRWAEKKLPSRTGAVGARSRGGLLQAAHARRARGRRARDARGARRGPGRPGLRGHLAHARRVRDVPRARRAAARLRRRRPHPGHGDGDAPRRAAARPRLHVRRHPPYP